MTFVTSWFIEIYPPKEVVVVSEMLHSSVFWNALLLAWVFTPLGMIAVGVIFESRVVPLWRNQAKSFMPGEAALGVVFAAGCYLSPQVAKDSIWASAKVPIAGLFIGFVVCYLMRTKFDGENNYSRAALDSPTKRYHDYVMYVIYLAGMVAICVPAILTATSWTGSNLDIKLFALAFFTVWIAGLLRDGTDPKMREKSKKMHVTIYRPIWKTWKVTFS